MIPKIILIATLFTIAFLLIKLICIFTENSKIYPIILCCVLAFISGLFWGLSLFGELWYEQVISYIFGTLCAVMFTPKLKTEKKEDIVLIGKTGIVTEIIDDNLPIEGKGKLDHGEDIVFYSKESLKTGDRFEITEVSDNIWVWKKE